MKPDTRCNSNLLVIGSECPSLRYAIIIRRQHGRRVVSFGADRPVRVRFVFLPVYLDGGFYEVTQVSLLRNHTILRELTTPDSSGRLPTSP